LVAYSYRPYMRVGLNGVETENDKLANNFRYVIGVGPAYK